MGKEGREELPKVVTFGLISLIMIMTTTQTKICFEEPRLVKQGQANEERIMTEAVRIKHKTDLEGNLFHVLCL